MTPPPPNPRVTLSVLPFQIRPRRRRQRRVRVPHGRVHLLPPMPSHQPALGVLPGDPLGGGADGPGSSERNVRGPQ